MSDAWAAPGSAAGDQPRPAAPVGDLAPAAGAPGVATRRPAPPSSGGLPLPAAFRPLTMVEVLDGGLGVVKRSPVPVLVVVAVFVVPYALAAAWLSRGFYDDGYGALVGSWTTTEASTQDTDLLTLLQYGVGPIVHVFAAAGVARLVVGWYAGEERTAGAVLRTVARRAWVLLVIWFLTRLLLLMGFVVLCLGSLVTVTFCLVAVPAALGEDLGPLRALGRSVALTRRRWWPSLGFALLSGLVATVVGQALVLLPQGVAFLVGVETMWLLVGLVSVAASTLTTAFVAGATTIWYLDLRVRSEGLDLDTQLAGSTS